MNQFRERSLSVSLILLNGFALVQRSQSLVVSYSDWDVISPGDINVN